MMTMLLLLVMMMMMMMMTVVTMTITCPVPTSQICFSIFHNAFPSDTDHLIKLIKQLDLLCRTEIATCACYFNS